jgi:gliding motility-associated-like protein
MLEKVYKRLIGIFFIFLFTNVGHAQYTVTGGAGTPGVFVENTLEKFQLYLVYGMNNVEIRYSSGSAPHQHQWYRYRTDPLNDSEPVPSTQEGNSSVVRTVEEGYGYYVREHENLGMNAFVWIIDYSKYEFDVRDIRVLDSDSQCEFISLTGTVHMPKMNYFLPSRKQEELKREIHIVYTTMEENREEQRFVLKEHTVTLNGNPFSEYLTAPLADTGFTIRGDQFARHFNLEKSATTDLYQAVSVKAGADTTVVSAEGDNVLPGTETQSYSAPVEITFKAYANTPVASLFKWAVYDETGKEIRGFTGEEATFSFSNKGKYTARLFVYSRSAIVQCTDSSQVFTFDVRESDLQVPNIFSPGTTPGINDEFKVAYKSLVRFNGWIFNRWGVELFHWTDPAKGWDGKKGGKYVPPGVYFYVIEAKGSDGVNYKKSGHVNIIRPKDVQDQIIE